MDKETFLNTIKEIGSIEDMAIIRTKLGEISDEISKIYDTNETLTSTNAKYEKDNETLRQANMQLFLRVGESKSSSDVQKDIVGQTIEEEKPKRKFEDLFDEKGMIK